MFRYILFTFVILAIVFIVSMIVRTALDSTPMEKSGRQRSEASVVPQNTGTALLVRVSDLLSQYRNLGATVHPALSTATKIGKWFGEKEIPEILQKELNELLDSKFVHTADMCVRDKNHQEDAEVLKSFALIRSRLDNIHNLLVESDKRQLGVSNFYWENKNNQPPSMDGY